MRKSRLLRLVRLLLALVLFGAFIGAGAVAVQGLNDRVASADAVIVPGNTVNPDGTLSNRLQARLDVALAIYRAGRCKVVFVSGAMGREGVDEAVAMKAYLVAQGIPPERVLQDSQGLNTEATARNAAQVLRQQGHSTVIAASQFFHVARVNRLLAAQGLVVAGHEHARYFEPRDAYSLLREVAALVALAAR
jgi:vancomycin permeability regulator SanA